MPPLNHDAIDPHHSTQVYTHNFEHQKNLAGADAGTKIPDSTIYFGGPPTWMNRNRIRSALELLADQ